MSLQKANEHLEALSCISGRVHTWEVVIMFYIASSLLRELRINRTGESSNSHSEIRRFVRRTCPEHIFAAYADLQDWSELVRYDNLNNGKTLDISAVDPARLYLDQVIHYTRALHRWVPNQVVLARAYLGQATIHYPFQ